MVSTTSSSPQRPAPQPSSSSSSSNKNKNTNATSTMSAAGGGTISAPMGGALVASPDDDLSVDMTATPPVTKTRGGTSDNAAAGVETTTATTNGNNSGSKSGNGGVTVNITIDDNMSISTSKRNNNNNNNRNYDHHRPSEFVITNSPTSSLHNNTNHDNHSLLGVIVDRSSFDEDDELTTFGGVGGGRGDLGSVMIDEESSVITGLPTTIGGGVGGTSSLFHPSGGMDGSGGSVGGNGGVMMRNGKVRRRLRWKPPRFGRKKSDGNVSSNMSVVSALTNKTTSTNRSTATSRSIFSHFSKRSMNSFHTFHSTETPVVTNKANRPQAPHTVMRPNYQDSFDANGTTTNTTSSSKHSTIDNEQRTITNGQLNYNQRARGGSGDWSRPNSSASTSENNDKHMERSSSLPDRLQDSTPPPMSPITEASPRSVSQRSGTSSVNYTGGPSSASSNRNDTNVNDTNVTGTDPSTTEKSKATPPRPRRPPLFKRRLRNLNKKNSSSSSSMNSSKNKNTLNHDNNRPISPTELSQYSGSSGHDGLLGTHTAPTASLSASLSLERENSILPTLSADEYEEDRRVSLHGTIPPSPGFTTPLPPKQSSSSSIVGDDDEEEKKEDEGEEVVVTDRLNANEENSITYTVGDQSANSGSASTNSMHSKPATFQGRRRTGSSASSQPNQDKAANSSTSSSGGRASPKPGSGSGGGGGIGSRIRRYNRPVDTMTPQVGGSSSASTSDTSNRRSMPADVDDGAYLEAEHNLRAIHEMAQEHLAHGEYEEAVEVFEEILRGQRERYGQDHYRVGTALHNLGIVYLKKGDYQRAIEICGRAVQVRKESLVPNHPDVAVSLAQLGVAHLESQHYDKALNAFQDALNIRRNFLGPRHPKCSKILNNIGCALYSMEEYEESKRAFDEALDIQRETLRHLPSAEGTESNGMQSNALLLSTASTLCNIGSIKLRWGDYDHAIIALDEALLIQQSVLGDDHPTVRSTLDSISFIETARGGPLQAATNDLLQGASAACNAGGSNVAEMLGFETFDASSPLQWFQNSCGALFEDNDDDGRDLTITNDEMKKKESMGNASIQLNDGSGSSPSPAAVKSKSDNSSPRDTSVNSSFPSSSSASSQSTPTSYPPDTASSSRVIKSPSTTRQQRQVKNFVTAKN